MALLCIPSCAEGPYNFSRNCETAFWEKNQLYLKCLVHKLITTGTTSKISNRALKFFQKDLIKHNFIQNYNVLRSISQTIDENIGVFTPTKANFAEEVIKTLDFEKNCQFFAENW
jgi:hypothetical protein